MVQVLWQQEPSYMVLLNDITSKVNYYQKIEEVSQYKDILLATVSHDFKTPLIATHQYVEMMENDLSQNNLSNISDYLEIIKSSNELLHSLTMDI